MIVAIYPGTFDPITFGHIDIIKRACCIFPKVLVVIAENPEKNPLFTIEERIDMVQNEFKDNPQIQVLHYTGLIVNCMQEHHATVIIRGLRTFSDFEHEYQMAFANKKLFPDIETVFLMSSADCSCLSSALVKQIAHLKGDLTSFVPVHVKKMFMTKS
jgi:pantetheine-phosphate adenylyltransferase